MIRICLIGFLLLGMGVFIRCANEQPKAEDCKSSAPVNPNGDSELAILMRKMTKHAEATKKALESGAELPAFPSEVNSIDEATPTDPDKHNPGFFSGTKVYRAALDRLYKADKAGRAECYQQLLNSCAACHNVVCPGPLKKIGRLRLQDDK